ncbi:MAG: hypothetical protein NTV04_23415 [Deltaproteobacteria bacterium]|nr:hypothetical protein [Deltaproteobacteria bacterium]
MMQNLNEVTGTRRSEWFVPKIGPPKFRSFIGLLFLPYTGMVLSFSVIGAMIASPLYWDRVLAIMVIYFLGLGIAAHALDALGSKTLKPWGTIFTRGQLWFMAALSLILAYLLAIYYMVRYVPVLWVLAISEGFFVFAYNLELFKGRFHTDTWFAFSWGFLPVLAGYIMQTNKISIAALTLAFAMALFSMVEIKASRPYKDLKQRIATLQEGERALMLRYEAILKSISLGVILLGTGLATWRMFG